MAPTRARLRAWLGGRGLSLFGAAWFGCLMLLAIASYPRDPSGAGYEFWSHYWCDLFDPLSETGLANGARWWAVGAMAGLALSLMALFWPHSWRSLPAGERVTSVLGLLGGAGVALVPVVTACGELGLHLALILVCGPPGLVAVVLKLAAQVRRSSGPETWAGAALVAFGVWNLAQYVRQSVGGAERWAGLPAVQKLATLALLVWLVLSAGAARQRDVGK